MRRELWNLVRDTALLMWRLPELVADWCDRTVMDWHRMVDMGEPRAPEPWCLRCNKPWPCDEFAEASHRLVGRRP